MDVNEPATFGVHLSYLSGEMHELSGKVDAIGEKVSALLVEMAKLPSIFASAAAVDSLAKRVDQVESKQDKDSGSDNSLYDLQARVKQLEAFVNRMMGFYIAGGVVLTIINILIASKGKVW